MTIVCAFVIYGDHFPITTYIKTFLHSKRVEESSKRIFVLEVIEDDEHSLNMLFTQLQL